MDDLPLPESGGEAIGIAIVVAILFGLYALVRRTQRRHYDEYWERRRFLEGHQLAEPDDPSELPSEWQRTEAPEPPEDRGPPDG